MQKTQKKIMNNNLTGQNLTGQKIDAQKVDQANILQKLDNEFKRDYKPFKIDEIAQSLSYKPYAAVPVPQKKGSLIPPLVESRFLPENSEFSPLNKNVETYLLEGLFSQIVQNPDSVTFNVTHDDKGKRQILVSTQDPIQYFSPLYNKKNNMTVDLMEIDVKDVDVSEVFARADLRHLNLDKTLMDKYASLQANKKPPEWFNKAIEKEIEDIDDSIKTMNDLSEEKLLNSTLKSLQDLQKLSYGEKIALVKYSENDYTTINGLLRGADFVLQTDSGKAAKQLKNGIMAALIIQNLLTKLDNPFSYPTLRVEREFRVEDLKNKTPKRLVVEDKSAISTSEKINPVFGKDINLIFNSDGGFNRFNSAGGLYIAPISTNPKEREILLPAGQFKIEKAAFIDCDRQKRFVGSMQSINVETDERKEQAKIAGPFDIKKHEYNITIEPNTDNIVAEYSQTTVIKKGSLLQDIKYDTVTEQPANNDDIVQKIASAPVLKSQVEKDKRLKSECQNLAAKMFGAEPEAYKTQSVVKKPTGMILS
jgi:hypothetical protein